MKKYQLLQATWLVALMMVLIGCALNYGALDDDFEDSIFSENWNVLNPGEAVITETNGSLQLEAAANSLWFHDSSAVLVWKGVPGNFKVTSFVSARRLSNPSQPPASPFRLGGLMARNPDTTNGENYVFIVVGADGNDVSVETKNTINSTSTFTGPSWPSGEGELRICRIDMNFYLYIRETSNDVWQLQAEFERPDLPSLLQVGPMAYANQGDPDLRVRFEFIEFASVNSVSDCT